MESFIEGLKKLDGYEEQIEHIEVLSPEKEEYQKLDKSLSSEISEYLEEEGISLYRHQTSLINKVREGRNAVIATPTASGKTLAFNIPIFEALKEDPDARALYIYPMKALTNDQLKVLREMHEATGISVSPAIYDGDTPRSKRPAIRRSSRIILTNPYGLHLYLPWHSKWREFYENLRFIVIDESHAYRGVFGSNVAMLVRRLRRICRRYGSDPQFILSSATIANPREHSKRLTGVDFSVVSEDYSDNGRKYFVLWNPPVMDEGFVRRSTHQETKDLFKECLRNGLQTLCFTVSRRMAELIARWSKEELYENSPALASAIASYRAGYLPEERREIERDLRQGKLLGVTSTNALELGIDVGSLDCVIISGYPGTIISTWQQAGRAGRTTEDSIVFLVAFQNPLDQYFMNHPEDFFGRSPEHAIIDLENPYISMGHLLCASAELPLTDEDESLFELFEEGKKSLRAREMIRETPLGLIYGGRRRPVADVKLNSISDRTVEVMHKGVLLETMDLNKAYNEAHEGAILLHRGETYTVEELDLKDMRAEVHKADVDYYTQPMKNVDISVEEAINERSEGLNVYCGRVQVTERYTHYRVKRHDSVIDIKSLDLPPLEFPSVGFWFTIPEDIVKGLEDEGLDLAGGIHAIEHAMIAMSPVYAICDRWDLGGVSTPYHPDTGKPTIFIYDSYEGGIGISEKLYQIMDDLVTTTLKLIRDCQCSEGCPSCIYSPKCGNDNQPLDKKSAIYILSEIQGKIGNNI